MLMIAKFCGLYANLANILLALFMVISRAIQGGGRNQGHILLSTEITWRLKAAQANRVRQARDHEHTTYGNRWGKNLKANANGHLSHQREAPTSTSSDCVCSIRFALFVPSDFSEVQSYDLNSPGARFILLQRNAIEYQRFALRSWLLQRIIIMQNDLIGLTRRWMSQLTIRHNLSILSDYCLTEIRWDISMSVIIYVAR